VKLRDKHGREIEPGDILRVFHFTGANRKRHYMYKQARYYNAGRLELSHLNNIDGEPWVIGVNYCTQKVSEGRWTDVEIVQSVDAKFEERSINGA
jgi:hypothetical protein